MVKGKDEWGEQTLACSPLKTRVTLISILVPSGGKPGNECWNVLHCGPDARDRTAGAALERE